MPAVGAGERSLLMAEQFALQQSVSQGGAVHRQEAMLIAVAMMINRPRDQFLSGAALAADQNGHVLSRHPADLLVNLEHLRAAADEHIVFVGLRLSLGKVDRRLHQAARLQGPLDQFLDLLQVERLGQVFIRSQFHGFDRHVAVVHGRDEYHRQLGVEVADRLGQLNARLPRKHNVQQQNVDLSRADQLHALLSAAGRMEFDLKLLQRGLDQAGNGPVVVDHQNVWHGKRVAFGKQELKQRGPAG